MAGNDATDDDLRPAYDLSQHEGGVRGKYFEHHGNGSSRLLASAVVCGAIPLTLGTIIYWTWRAKRLPWLEVAGLINIFTGLVLFTFGAICLAAYGFRESRTLGKRRVPLGWQIVLVAGLLLINFPAAAMYGISAMRLMNFRNVVIVNDSGKTIESFMLQAPGVEVEVGPIEPNKIAIRNLDFHSDGKLNFSAKQGDFQFGGQLEGYLTGGTGGETIVRVQPDGKFEVLRNLD
jgi:hypothetical protein